MKVFVTSLCGALVLAGLGLARAETLPAIFEAAHADFQAGRLGDAAAGYGRLLQLGVRDPDVYYDLGVSWGTAGQYGRALWAFERALRLRPGDAGAVAGWERAWQVAERQGARAAVSQRVLGWLRQRMPDTALAAALLLTSAALALCVGWVWWRRRGHWLVVVSAAVFALAVGVWFGRERALTNGSAVVFQNQTLERASLNDTRRGVTVAEGSYVRVLRRAGQRVLVRADGGAEGWLPATMVGQI